jgi:hypothetical protein
MTTQAPLPRPVPLDRRHDPSAFDCGAPALDENLRKYAWQNHQNELARHVLGLSFGEEDKARMHELAVGNQEGALSVEDKEELHNYIKVGHLLAVLQSQARQAL